MKWIPEHVWCKKLCDPWRRGHFGIDEPFCIVSISRNTWLTHWGRVMHICVSNLTIIASDNGLSPVRRQAIIWNNARMLLIGPLGTKFSEIQIGIQTFSFKKMHLKMAKRRPFCIGLSELTCDDYWERCHSQSWEFWHMISLLGILQWVAYDKQLSYTIKLIVNKTHSQLNWIGCSFFYKCNIFFY